MNNQLKWKALLALFIIYVAIIFNLMWLWGVLLLVWVFQDIKSAGTHLLEPVPRSTNPALFWTIEMTWVLLAIFLILYDLGVLDHYLNS